MGKLPDLGVRDEVQSCPGYVVSRAFSHLQAMPPSSGELPFLCSPPLRPLCCCAHGGQVTTPSWAQGWLGHCQHCSSPRFGGAGPPKCRAAPDGPRARLEAGRFVPLAPMCAQSLFTEAMRRMSLGMLGSRAAPVRLGVPGCHSVCSWCWLQSSSCGVPPHPPPSEPQLAWGTDVSSSHRGVPYPPKSSPPSWACCARTTSSLLSPAVPRHWCGAEHPAAQRWARLPPHEAQPDPVHRDGRPGGETPPRSHRGAGRNPAGLTQGLRSLIYAPARL